MPTLSIPLPEGEKVVLLRGSRISVGRFSDNTIQIPDRTVSGYHFQLHFEGDHYRLHDSGSVNGVMVNGRKVNDYHLREACEILIGTVRCDFHPGHPMNARCETIELLPVQEEVMAVRDEIHKLKVENLALKEQVALMEASRKDDGTKALDECLAARTLQLLELDRLRGSTKELGTKLSILSRERDNLERLYRELLSEMTNLRPNSPDAVAAALGAASSLQAAFIAKALKSASKN